MPSAVVDAAFTAAPAALRSAPPSTGAAAVGARLGAACRHRPGARLAWRAAADGGGKDDGGGGAGDAAGGGAKKGFGGAAKAATPVKGGAKAIPPPPPPPGRGLPDLSVDERQRLEARDASGVSMMDRLQEETQAPFRKVRMFFYASFAAGASVGGLIAGTRILAALSGVSGAQPLAETVPNLVIDVVAVTAFALLLRRDAEAGRKRLARIAKTVDVGDLPVVRAGAGGGDKTVDLSTLRGRARPVIVSGRAKEVFAAVRGAEAAAADLSRVGVVVVPVVTGGGVGLAEPPHGDWLAMPAPADADVWAEWEDSARTGTRAKGGGRPPKRALMVLVVRKDGRIGARSFTDAVEWDKLVAEIDALPAKDQYGQP
ncbi:hypothetical protein I4F81_004318 [Pyropia yezoensis]|uniref:Uncharacterized protein n=1 Tax=Pyropia yezoensis TaxID=2788 RepID=A0ACC3BVY3_PYRYE|nr:hypothetical protein I4F81_004318 [Neopyropia yezoensis]